MNHLKLSFMFILAAVHIAALPMHSDPFRNPSADPNAPPEPFLSSGTPWTSLYKESSTHSTSHLAQAVPQAMFPWESSGHQESNLEQFWHPFWHPQSPPPGVSALPFTTLGHQESNLEHSQSPPPLDAALPSHTGLQRTHKGHGRSHRATPYARPTGSSHPEGHSSNASPPQPEASGSHPPRKRAKMRPIDIDAEFTRLYPEDEGGPGYRCNRGSRKVCKNVIKIENCDSELPEEELHKVLGLRQHVALDRVKEKNDPHDRNAQPSNSHLPSSQNPPLPATIDTPRHPDPSHALPSLAHASQSSIHGSTGHPESQSPPGSLPATIDTPRHPDPSQALPSLAHASQSSIHGSTGHPEGHVHSQSSIHGSTGHPEDHVHPQPCDSHVCERKIAVKRTIDIDAEFTRLYPEDEGGPGYKCKNGSRKRCKNVIALEDHHSTMSEDDIKREMKRRLKKHVVDDRLNEHKKGHAK